jgi:hypothetical protein
LAVTRRRHPTAVARLGVRRRRPRRPNRQPHRITAAIWSVAALAGGSGSSWRFGCTRPKSYAGSGLLSPPNSSIG